MKDMVQTYTRGWRCASAAHPFFGRQGHGPSITRDLVHFYTGKFTSVLYLIYLNFLISKKIFFFVGGDFWSVDFDRPPPPY